MRLSPVFLLIASMLAGGLAHGRTVLRNDSFQPGDAVAFYTRIGQEESFAAIFEVPDDHPEYRICRVLAFVGPAGGFNIYTLRFGIAGEDGGEIGAGEGLIWQTNEDAYRVQGSDNQIGVFDLTGENIVTDARRLRLQLRVVSAERAPNIATDTDGITPERNYVRVVLRNGQSFRGFTELMNPMGSPPQPPGDWVLRTEIARLDEDCLDPEAPPLDWGPPDGVNDMGLGRDDMGVPDAGPVPDAEPVADASFERDAAVDMHVGIRDAEPVTDAARADTGGRPIGDDAALAPDATQQGDRGVGPGGEPLELTRMVPDRGPGDRNTEVLINGRGFLDGGGLVRAELGEARLLEVDALSGSTVSALVPAGLAAGRHDLRLTRSDGQVAVLPAAFTIEGAPPAPLMLRAVEPESIAAGNPAELTVLGAGFTAGTEFSVGGAPLIDVVIDGGGEQARGTLTVALSAGIYDLVARRGDDVARLERAIEVRTSRGEPDGCRAAPGSPSGSGPFALTLLVLGAIARRRT